MALPSVLRKQPWNQAGFTLVELMIAAALGLGLAFVAGSAMVSHLRSSARSESLQRLREDWNRATSFIESEIAISSRIFINPAMISLPEDATQCDLTASEVRMALDLARDLPLVIYGVREVSPTQTDWIVPSASNKAVKAGVLIRCGPDLTITRDGVDDYSRTGDMQQTIFLDGVELDEEGKGGLIVTLNDAKSASFKLQMIGILSSRYSFGSGTYSRINPVAGYPEELSTCSRVCGYKKNSDGEIITDASGDPVRECRDIGGYKVISLTSENASTYTLPTSGLNLNDNVTICSLRSSDSFRDNITGSVVGDVIDAWPQPGDPGIGSYAGAVINGLDGRNILLGTPGPDSITGGNDADTLVGRGGGDILNGDDGNNSYLPWPDLGGVTQLSNTTIQGGSGLDVVYLRGTRNDFSDTSGCSQAECTISAKGGSLTMTNVNVLIFKDARVDLP